MSQFLYSGPSSYFMIKIVYIYKTLVALFPKLKVIKRLISCNEAESRAFNRHIDYVYPILRYRIIAALVIQPLITVVYPRRRKCMITIHVAPLTTDP